MDMEGDKEGDKEKGDQDRQKDPTYGLGRMNADPLTYGTLRGGPPSTPDYHTPLPPGLRCCYGGNQRKLPGPSHRWVVLVLTFLFYTTYHMSRKPLSVVKNVLHCNGLKFNCTSWEPFDKSDYKELLGALDYAFLVPYAIGMFISGQVAERSDLRYYLSFGMISSGLAISLFGFGRFWNIHSIVYYIFVQVLAGLLSATGWPAVVTCVANWFGKSRRGLIMGVWNSHTSVGNIVGSLIAGAFVMENWGLSFIVPGLIIITAGVFCFLFLMPKPESNFVTDGSEHNNCDQLEVYQIEDMELPLVKDENEQEKAISLFGALKIPGVVEFSLCLFFSKLVNYTFLYWLPTFIAHMSILNAENSAYLSTTFDFGGIIGGIFAGAISDAYGGHATVCAVMLAVSIPLLLAYESMAALSSLAFNIVLLLILGVFVNGPYALITTAVSANLGTHPSIVNSARALSTVTAIIDGTGSMGAALGPFLAGTITQTGWANVFYMLIASSAAALLLLSRQVYNDCVMWRDNKTDKKSSSIDETPKGKPPS